MFLMHLKVLRTFQAIRIGTAAAGASRLDNFYDIFLFMKNVVNVVIGSGESVFVLNFIELLWLLNYG